jgi:hypothetical protein
VDPHPIISVALLVLSFPLMYLAYFSGLAFYQGAFIACSFVNGTLWGLFLMWAGSTLQDAASPPCTVRTTQARRPRLDILPRTTGWYVALMLRFVRRRWRWLLAIGIFAIAHVAWNFYWLPAFRYNAGLYARLRLGMTRDQVIQMMGPHQTPFDDVFAMIGCGSWRTTACDAMIDDSLKQHWWYCYVPMGSGPRRPRAGGPPEVDYWTDGSVIIGVVYRAGRVDQKLMNVRIPSWEMKLRQWLDGI